MNSQRPATQHRGPAQRFPSRTYCNLTCKSWRQGADVGACGFCGWVCCVANNHCHKQITANVDAHWGALGNTALKPEDLRQKRRK